MTTSAPDGESILHRMLEAVHRVQQRLVRATNALAQAEIEYAVAGGHAEAMWVARIDLGGVRTTPDVDIVVRRRDLLRVNGALEDAGFVGDDGEDLFLDRHGASRREAVHILFSLERLSADQVEPNPDVGERTVIDGLWVLSLEALVRTKLSEFRLKDRVHLRDMLDVGVIDDSWTRRLQPVLAARLQSLIDTPDG